MRIALLMSGGLGKFCFPSQCSIAEKWKLIVNKYNIDVFCVADDNNYYDINSDAQIFPESNKKQETPNNDSWRYYKNIKTSTYEKSKPTIKKIILNSFGEHTKGLKIFDFDKLNLEFLKNNNNHDFFYNYRSLINGHPTRSEYIKLANLSQFYKLEECFKLMKEYEDENNFRYDMIIRCRFDCILESLYDNTVNLQELKINNTFYCPTNGDHIMDWWGIGNRNIMGEYCRYYSNFAGGLKSGYRFVIYHNMKGKYLGCDKGYNFKKKDDTTIIQQDISDANEVGLTFILKVKNDYKITTKINMFCDRSYADN